MTISSPPSATQALLRAENIVVERNRRRVLDGISLDVRAGEVVALLGANGSGKSTLLEVLLGARRPDAGGVWLGSEALTWLAPPDRARRVTLVAQDALPDFPLSVEELVALGVRAHKPLFASLTREEAERIEAAIAEVGLQALRARRVDTLSGGERQRAHLARALAQGAPLLLLDEPTSHLDVRCQIELVELAQRHASNGGAAVIALHDLALAARAASRLFVLAAGRWVAGGPPERVLSPATVARAFGVRARVLLGSDGRVDHVVVVGRADGFVVEQGERKDGVAPC